MAQDRISLTLAPATLTAVDNALAALETALTQLVALEADELPCLLQAGGGPVEALQLLLACGSCDVDDVLLNLAGTLIVFGILKLPFLQRLLKRLYLLPEPDQQPAEALADATLPESTPPSATA